MSSFNFPTSGFPPMDSSNQSTSNSSASNLLNSSGISLNTNQSPIQQQPMNQFSVGGNIGMTNTPTPQQLQNTSPSQQKEKTQLWMGELDPWWDESTIRSIWSSLGENVVNVKLIKEKNLDPNVQAPNNAGYCFVDFGSYMNASKAIMKSGLLIPGTSNKVLKLNWASGSNSGFLNPVTPNGSLNNNLNESSIFIGDLPNDLQEHDLFELFRSRYASVTNAKVMMDPLSGTSRGYGFVRFANEADQQRALIEMNGVVVNGRALRVSTAVPKNNNNGPNSAQSLFTMNSPTRSLTGPPTTVGSNVSNGNQFQPPLTQYTDPNNTTVFVGGLSNGVTEQQLRSFFQSFGDIIYVKVLNNKGCGFVQYVLRSSAENAIQQMQGYPIGNSRIRLSWGRSSAQNNQNQQKYLQQLTTPAVYSQFNPTQDFNNNLNNNINQDFNNLNNSINNLSSDFNILGNNSNLSNSNILGGNPLGNSLLGSSVNQMPIQNGNVSGLAAPVPTGLSQSAFSSTLAAPSNIGTSNSNDQLRLNSLLNGSRDGRLDQVEQTSNGFIYA